MIYHNQVCAIRSELVSMKPASQSPYILSMIKLLSSNKYPSYYVRLFINMRTYSKSNIGESFLLSKQMFGKSQTFIIKSYVGGMKMYTSVY